MREKLKYVVLISVFLLFIFSGNVLASMNCEEVEGDSTHQLCTEIKTQVYNTTVPVINVTFQEYVQIQNFILYRIGDLGMEFPINPFIVEENHVSIPLTHVDSSYSPTRHVSDGVYIFRINAFNVPNINIDVAVLFSINGTSMKYWVTKPENIHVTPDEKPNFAVSNNSVFLLELEAQREIEECRFTVFPADIGSDSSLEEIFINMGDTNKFITNSTMNTRAHISNFDICQYYSYSGCDSNGEFNGELRVMYIICKEPQEKYSFKEIFVGVDQSAPTINVFAVPNPIADYNLRQTNISIQTNDRSVCVAIKTNQPSQAENLPIINRSQNYDFESLDEFMNNYGERWIFNHQPNPYNYTYNITCDNLANLRSSMNYAINVDLEIPQSFIFYSPMGTINSSTILINGSVNIGSANCMATLNKTNPSSFISLIKHEGSYDSLGRQLFSGTINNVPDGDNIIYVNCTYMASGAFAETTFIVDKTPPTAPNITMAENSCSLTKITAIAESRDNITGVDKYYYILNISTDPSNNSKSGTTNDGKISINIDGEEVDGQIYVLKVWAKDNAGNIGSSSSMSIKVTNSSIVPCDKTKPNIHIIATQNNLTNEWVVKVNCTDIHSGCQQSFSYGIETNNSADCTVSTQAGLLMPINILNSAVFCATVYDNNNNNKSDERRFTVTFPISCSNLQKDGNETDLDCGGECPKCINGKLCKLNSDCARNYCLNNICADSSCIDMYKNGDETGLDCGGSCSPCAIGVGCVGDYDCQSLNCVNNSCVQANCTDNKKDGLETGVDCGGNCNKCERWLGCLTASDCVTAYCDQITKVCDIDPTLDTDNDGLPDVWEEKYCGSFTGCDPNADTDGDEYTNLEEFKAGTDPLNPDSYPDYKKYNKVSLVFLILGILLIIAGIIVKVLSVLDEQKTYHAHEDKEMTMTLSQIPKITSLHSVEERKVNSLEDEKLRQQTRNNAMKIKEFERKKVLSQFDDADDKITKSSSKTSSSKKTEEMFSEQKITESTKNNTTRDVTSSKNRHYADEGTKDEYVSLSDLKEKKSEDDAFSKLKDLTNSKNTKQKISEETNKHSKTNLDATNKVQGSTKQIAKSQKSSKNDEVFEKLKKMTKQTKK